MKTSIIDNLLEWKSEMWDDINKERFNHFWELKDERN